MTFRDASYARFGLAPETGAAAPEHSRWTAPRFRCARG